MSWKRRGAPTAASLPCIRWRTADQKPCRRQLVGRRGQGAPIPCLHGMGAVNCPPVHIRAISAWAAPSLPVC